MTNHSVSNRPPASAPQAAEVQELPRKKAPLAGVLGALALALGLAGWTGVRIVNATQKQEVIAAQRSADAEKSRALANAPLDVRVVSPVARSWEPSVELDGTLFAGQAAELGFKLNGKLAQVDVKVGQSVKAGQVLAQLDAREAAARLRAARAQVRAAQAELALASDSDRRTSSMVESGALAEASGVQTTQNKALASARVESAEAEVALAEVELTHHRLLAPFAGSVLRAPDGVGSVVNSGQAQFELADLSRLKLKGTLGEGDAALVKPGSELVINTEHGAVKGTVTSVLGMVDGATRRVRVEAGIDNRAEPKLRAGSFVRGTIKSGAPISVFELPPEVLRPGGQDEVLAVVDGHTVSRRLTYSVDKNGKLLVRFGLEASDRVVLSPKAELEAGHAVNIVADGSTP
jgi:RND family efflux transporter MFP subunit